MKIRSVFVSNSSSSSFILNGSWIKVYGTGFTPIDDGSIQFNIAKTDRHGMSSMEHQTILKLQSLFRDESFSHIKKFGKSEGIITNIGSFIYEDGGCFYGHFFGDDIKLVDDIKGVLNRQAVMLY